LARLTDGWIKLHRDLLEKEDIMSKPSRLAVWIWLLLTANYKPSRIDWKSKPRDLPAGAVLFAVEEVSVTLHINSRVIRNELKYLESARVIEYNTCRHVTKGSLVLIINWDTYQFDADALVTRRELEGNYKVTRRELEGNLIKESTEHKKERNTYNPFKFEIEECLQEWENTLRKFGINKPAQLDEIPIGSLIQRFGFEKTKLALLGAGFEASSTNFDPTKHVTITRLSKSGLFDKFVNLGAQNQPKDRHVHGLNSENV